MKRAVVTGGAGFIGSHVVEELLARDCSVLVIDDFSSGSEANLATFPQASKINIERVSISSAAASAALSAFKPNVVIHFAAQMNVRKSVEDPVFDAEANIMGTVNLLEAARKAGTEAFLFSSTGGAIYGEQEYFPADEKHPIHPKCPYGVSKRAAELYLDYYGREYGMRTVSLRLGNVYGPRQSSRGEAGVVAIFIDRALQGQDLLVHGDGEQTRDFVYVKDVVAAFFGVLEATGGGSGFEIFNVGTGIESSVNAVAQVIQRCIIERFETQQRVATSIPQILHGPAMPGEQRRSVISSEKLHSVCRLNRPMSLASGLSLTFESFLQHQ